MYRIKATALTVAACAALLVTVPTFAQTGTTTGTPTTPAPNTTTLHHRHDLTCGKITELGSDHATLTKDDGSTVRILLGDNTRFIARSFAAATAGLKVGDFAAVAGGDGQGAPAHALLFALEDLCGKGHHGQNIRVKGVVADFTLNTLTVTAAGHDPYDFALTGSTKFYVNGHLVQVPDFKIGEAVAVLAHEEQPGGSYNALIVRLRTK